MKYLSNLGHDVTIINYRPDYLTYNLFRIGEKYKQNIFLSVMFFIYVIPKRLMLSKSRDKFKKFIQDYLRFDSETYLNYSELKNNPPKADVYFSGSDQIWNTDVQNGRDPAFYLDFVSGDKVKASYAASFSHTRIVPEYVDFVKESIKKLDFVSVREATGMRILDSLQINNGKLVFDPVFLLPSTFWDGMSNYEPNEKYIFIYDQENNHLIKEIAIKLSKEYGYKIYANESLYSMSYAHKRIRDAGPKEFLGYIKNCEICITNSFHCMSFSIIFGREFFVSKRNNSDVNSRIIDLLEYFEIGNRVVGNVEEVKLSEPIDYSKIKNLIDLRVNESEQYIKEVLNSAYAKQ
jgi:hypothetical protein